MRGQVLAAVLLAVGFGCDADQARPAAKAEPGERQRSTSARRVDSAAGKGLAPGGNVEAKGARVRPTEPDAAVADPQPSDHGVEAAASASAHRAIQLRQLGEPLAPSPLVHDVPIAFPEALEAFWTALGELESGAAADGTKLRIAVYGSSSVAADRYTGYLQARYGDGGPGFVAAVPLWRWHRHQEVALASSRGWTVEHALRLPAGQVGQLGLMGVRARTRAPGAHLRVELRGLSEVVEQVELWTAASSVRSTLVLRLDGRRLSAETSTHAALSIRRVERAAGVRTLELRWTGGAPLELYGAVLERAAAGVVVDTLGIGGSGLRRMLAWDEPSWAAQLRRRDPELVILAFGSIESMRDDHDPARWLAELEQALARLRRAVPAASCLLIGPQDQAHRVRRARRTDGGGDGPRRRPAHLDPIIAAERQVAAAQGCGFWDTQAMMGGPGSMPSWVAAGLARKDHVHLSPRGYAHMGAALVDALLATRGGAGRAR